MRYSIIIPCYNEEKNIKKLIERLETVFSDQTDIEIVLVENGSLDNSRKVMEQACDRKRLFKIVYVDVNQGYGYGIKQGIEKSIGKYVGWLHADLQVDPACMKTFFKYIDSDFSNNQYFLKGKRSNRHFIEYFFSFGMSGFETILFRKKMYEVMAMPVLMNKDLLSDLGDIPDDFAIDIYVYALAVSQNYSVKHFPVRVVDRIEGESSWNKGLASRIRQSKKMIIASMAVKNTLKRRILG